MLPYIAEFIGTSMMILLGCGLCAGVSLNKSGMKGGGTVHVTLGWAFAVMLPAFIFGAASGAHFNPAVTLAMAMVGKISWALVPGYFACQFAGAFVGALFVWILYKKQFDATEDSYAKLRVFATDATIPCLPLNILAECIATFVLIFAILGIAQVPGIAGGLSNIFVFGIIASIGMSLGGLTGYAINPARDIAPRLVHTLLPIKNKHSNKWSYAIVPLVGPMLGAALAALTYMAIPW